jgi:hypothetical protein
MLFRSNQPNRMKRRVAAVDEDSERPDLARAHGTGQIPIRHE